MREAGKAAAHLSVVAIVSFLTFFDFFHLGQPFFSAVRTIWRFPPIHLSGFSPVNPASVYLYRFV
jgi:hypothetical protein